MIKAADLLFRAPKADKPTILLLIDRNELEDQMLKNLDALGLGNLEHAGSITRLKRLLKDDYRGYCRGGICGYNAAQPNPQSPSCPPPKTATYTPLKRIRTTSSIHN